MCPWGGRSGWAGSQERPPSVGVGWRVLPGAAGVLILHSQRAAGFHHSECFPWFKHRMFGDTGLPPLCERGTGGQGVGDIRTRTSWPELRFVMTRETFPPGAPVRASTFHVSSSSRDHRGLHSRTNHVLPSPGGQ